MHFHKINVKKSIPVLLFILVSSLAVFAQDDSEKIDSTLVFNDELTRDMTEAVRSNLYCAGYISEVSFNTKFEIVGATDEKEQYNFAEGDELYINVGSVDGIKKGDVFQVVRPRGKVKSEWSRKNLGVYVQELGAVEVMHVMSNVSVVMVKDSCGAMQFGDLLTPMPSRQSPLFKDRPALDLHAAPSGKARGRIVMARDHQEMIGRDQIVYIDLGREDNVSVGDYLTVFRPLGTGDIFQKMLKNMADNKEEGYSSDRYEGDEFSNQAARKKGSSGTGETTNEEDVRSRRPDDLRRVVGQLVVLNVTNRTATAMVVRNASEIHTGDHVEVQ